jgi:glyoxylase-like metal-dependent hydrolase (beta-lactamase superfamily II)
MMVEDPVAPGAMEIVVPGLRASAPLRLAFGRRLDARAFVLEREHGNVLVYGAASLGPHLAEVEALGGLTRQYLNHSHEATPEADTVARRFGAPLFVHAADAAQTARTATVRATFDRRHHLDDDLEIIPIAGHTPGATAYLRDTSEHRVLFTGDSLYLRDGAWSAALLDGVSDRDSYIASLELLRSLDVDILAPGIATGGRAWHAATDGADAHERIGAVIERLRAGGDH